MKEGRFVSKYWGKQLTKILEEKSGCNHLLFYATNSEVSFKEAVNQLKFLQKHDTSNNFYLLEQFNNFSGLLCSFISFLKHAIKFSRLFNPSFFGMNGSKLNLFFTHKDDLEISLRGAELANSIIRFNKFEQAFQLLGKDSVFLYLMEMQGWETIANFCFKKHHGACSVGVIHATVKNMMLNFFHNRETYCQNSFPMPMPMPMPDIICCNTYDCLDYFKSQNLQNLFPVEAQRFSYLSKLQTKPQQPISEYVLLVTTSINKQESEALLRMLAKANHYKSLLYTKILVKGHPDLPLRPIIENIDNFPTHELSNKPIMELLKEASVLFTTNS